MTDFEPSTPPPLGDQSSTLSRANLNSLEQHESLRRLPLIKPQFSGVIEFEHGRSEKREISWSVAGNEVYVMPRSNFELLSQALKAEMFNKILAHYRSLSQHPQGLFSSALVVSSEGRIFIAANAQKQQEYHKDCAEVNVVNALTQLDKKGAKIDELYIMVGHYNPKEDFDSSTVESPYCPCGKCSDLLYREASRNAKLFTIPANDGSLPVVLDERSTSINQVKKGEAWVTPLSVLMKDFRVELNQEVMGIQAGALVKLTRLEAKNVPEEIDSKKLAQILEASDAELEPEAQRIKKLTLRAVHNQTRGSKSIIELDVATPENFWQEVNLYMVKEINQSYQARLAPDKTSKGTERVRCVVVRLDDGTFHSCVEAEGPNDNALPYAEVLATGASDRLRNKITDVWVMDMSPADIRAGVMQTSSKEGLERLYKRRPRSEVTDFNGDALVEDINIHFIPYNSGDLSNIAVKGLVSSYKIRDLFASLWKGVVSCREEVPPLKS